jgi:hypothetical protein
MIEQWKMAAYYNRLSWNCRAIFWNTETIENPLCIYQGNYDELIAVGRIGYIQDKFIVVVYKEKSFLDGFVITAYISNKMQSFKKKKIIWKQR